LQSFRFALFPKRLIGYVSGGVNAYRFYPSKFYGVYFLFLSKEGSYVDKISKSLGLRIRSLRVSRELSQDALAEMAGMSVKHLGKIERGTVNASVQCLTDIAEALDLPLRDILETEHERSREELLAELADALPKLPIKDMRIVYRLVNILAGR
jgi:transcriptional regulator with XRE-family HTH domain